MKAANRNFFLLGIPAVLILAAGITLFFFGDGLLQMSQSMAPELPEGEVGDVEGYAFLIGLFGSGIGQLVGLFVQVVALLIAIYGGAILALSILARAIYKTTPGRILAYRIVMALNFVLLLLPVPSLLSSFISSSANGKFSFGLLAYLILTALLTVFGCFNTYTSRIKLPKPVEREKGEC